VCTAVKRKNMTFDQTVVASLVHNQELTIDDAWLHVVMLRLYNKTPDGTINLWDSVLIRVFRDRDFPAVVQLLKCLACDEGWSDGK